MADVEIETDDESEVMIESEKVESELVKREEEVATELKVEEETPSKSAEVSENVTASSSSDQSSDNVTYDINNEPIFTDPTTQYKYKWCKESNQWKLMEETVTENEHYRWCNDTQKWILKETAAATQENEFYRWCDKTEKWIPKVSAAQSADGNVTYDYDEKEGVHTYTDKDNAVFFYDVEKKAWFPKVDDDFLAVYQMNYGFIDNTTKADEKPKVVPVPVAPLEMLEPTDDDSVGGKKRKAPAAPPKWFEVAPEQNTKVYVSNLPLDVTDEEFSELMAKCGMVMKDGKGLLKLKLYREKTGELKGDGLCHYIKVSVNCLINSFILNFKCLNFSFYSIYVDIFFTFFFFYIN